MRKITFLFLLVGTFAFAQFPAPYCGPNTYTSNVEPITLVQFAGIDNPSSAALAGTAHEDFTAISGNVVAGAPHPILLMGNTDGAFTTYYRVFIDWNQDNDFEDPGESYNVGTIYGSTGTDDIVLEGIINVPPDALAGTTRMRVMKRFNAYSSNACQVGAGYGQSEDYSLVVTVPDCVTPSSVTVAVTSSTSAEFSWASDETNFEVFVQEAGGGAPADANDTGENVSGLSYSLSDLFPVTAYEFYIRTECTDSTEFSFWAGPFVFNTTQVPGCSAVVYPEDAAVDVPVGTVPFSWEAPATGDPAVSYDMYYGLTPETVTNLVGNFTATTVDINLTGFGTVFYWKIVPKNIAGEAIGCAIWSFTTMEAPGYCLTGSLFPEEVYTPEVCDGVTENIIVNNAWAGEYSVVSVVAGEPYTFKSSVATDLITISSDGGATAVAYGITPVTWVADVTGEINFYIHTDIECGTQNAARVRSIVCGEVSADAPDWANLQFPYEATFEVGGTVMVYGQVYASGLTDVEPNIEGQAPGILAWVGVSPVGQNTNPDTWTTWIPATWNGGYVGNNDEYQAEIGTGLTAGTYYYATRFRLNDGGYVYGGTNNGFWDGTTYLSGVLTVTPPPAPDNDECANATPLTPGAVFEDNAITSTSTNATVNAANPVPSCGNFNFATNGKDVWFSVVVPDSGTLTVETQGNGGLGDTALEIYSGTCEALTYINCNDDINFPSNPYSRLELTDLTPGETLLVRVWGYNGAQGSFVVSAYDASLSTGSFDNAGFKYYPNPVKDVLNLNYTSTITNVSVVNLLGQQVLAKNVNANVSQLDLSSLSAGTYLVKVTTEENFEKTIKIVKQ